MNVRGLYAARIRGLVFADTPTHSLRCGLKYAARLRWLSALAFRSRLAVTSGVDSVLCLRQSRKASFSGFLATGYRLQSLRDFFHSF
jgi:hypothetical protein